MAKVFNYQFPLELSLSEVNGAESVSVKLKDALRPVDDEKQQKED